MNKKEKLIDLIQESVGGWMRDDIANMIAEHIISKNYENLVACPICDNYKKITDMIKSENMCQNCYLTLLKMRSGQ